LVSGFDAVQAGMIMLVQPIMMAFFSPIGGRLSDRVEPRIVSSIGMSIVAASVFSLALLGPATPWWKIALRLIVLGIGYAFFSSPIPTPTMSPVDHNQYGAPAAILSTSRFTGQAISLAVSTSVLSAHVGGIPIAGRAGTQLPVAAFMDGMKVALTILACISA